MESRPLNTKVKKLPASTLAERLLYCAGMLHMAGFITDSERFKIHARMMKWKKSMQSTRAAGGRG